MRIDPIFPLVSLLAVLTECSNVSATDDSLLWGPYRPNLYFGVRPRIPKSLNTGLLWSRVDDYTHMQTKLRYTCEQNEGMLGYGWEEYDIRTGGRQVIHDLGNSIDVTTEFIKVPRGQHGGSWAARISGRPRKDAPEDIKTTMIFYAAMQGMGEDAGFNAEPSALHMEQTKNEKGYEGTVSLAGSTKELGTFRLSVTEGPSTNRHPQVDHYEAEKKPLDRTMMQSGSIPEEHLWQAKAIVFQTIQKEVKDFLDKYGESDMPPAPITLTIPNGDIGTGNFHLIQKVFEGAFEFDIIFSSVSGGKELTTEDVTTELTTASRDFKTKYSTIFKAQAPFISSKYDKFSQTMFSNLLGGIGYFYGDSVIDRSYNEAYEEENDGFWEDAAEARSKTRPDLEGPYELFSAVPSRPFFPRGFLWDEGFHLLPIVDWDSELTFEILTSWFNLMDKNGWIAREQILGDEARSKVPQEFQVQYPHYANPPTLFLTLEALLDKMESSPSSNNEPYMDFFRSVYPRLKLHYQWYRDTQFGDIKSYDRDAFSTKEAYRWRGRTPQHILPSGLDDYPRAQPPHPGELHVDLHSWMGLMSRSLSRIASVLDEAADAKKYAAIQTAIVRNLDDLHWSEKDNTFCDATIDAWEESMHVCHKGYISIFPFLTGLLSPTHPHLGAVLDLIADPKELWSDYGIRSLSKKDSLYGTAENYWRSPVWININYLVVTNLLKIAQAEGGENSHREKAASMYSALRKNLVDTIYKNWEETGFAWEQYNPETGKGQRTRHFTGWTSLVVKLLCLPSLEGGGREAGVRDEL